MAEFIEFGVKITGDGSALVGAMQVTKAQVDQLKQSFGGVGDSLDKMLRQSDSAKQAFTSAGQEGRKAFTDTSAAADALGRSFSKFGDESKKAGDASRKAFKDSADGADIFGRTINQVKGYLLGMVSVGAIVGLVREFIEVSDAASTTAARIKSVTESTREYLEVQTALSQIAQRNQVDLPQLSKQYADLASSIQEIGGNGKTATDVLAGLTAAARAEGKSIEESGQLVTQFSAAVLLGVNGGRELRTILKDNSLLAKTLADGLGVTTSALKEMAAQGKITGADLVNVLNQALPQLEAQAAKIPPTIGGAFTATFNLIRQQVSSGGAGSAFAQWLTDLVALTQKVNDAGVTMAQRFNIAFDTLIGGAARGVAALKAIDAEFVRTAGGRLARGTISQPPEGTVTALGGEQAKAALNSLIEASNTPEGINARFDRQAELIKKNWNTMSITETAGATEYSTKVKSLLAGLEKDRLIQLDSLARKGTPNISLIFGDLDKQTALAKAGFDTLLAIQNQGLQEQQQSLDTAHALGIISERDFIEQRGAIAVQAAQAQLADIKSTYTQTLQQLTDVQSKTPIGLDQQALKKQQIETLTAKLVELTKQWAIGEAKVGEEGKKTGDALAIYDQAHVDALRNVNRETDDYIKKLNDQVDEIQFQIELLGKTEVAQKQATAERAIQLDLATKLLALDRQIEDLHGSDPALIAAIRAEQQRLTDEAKRTTDAIKDGIAAQDQAQNRLTGLNDAWTGIKDTVSGAADALKNGWSSAIDYVKQRLVSVLVRYLEELAEKQFILPLFVQMTNAGSGFGQGAGSFPTLNSVGSLFSGGQGSGLGSIFGGLGSLFGGGAVGSEAAAAGIGLGNLSLGIEAGAAAAGTAAAGFGTAAAAMIPVVGWIVAAGALIYSFIQRNKEPAQVKGKFQVSGGTGSFEDNAYTKTKFGNIGFSDAETQQFSGEAAQQFNKVIAGALDAIATRLTPEQIKKVTGELQGINFPGAEGTFTTEDFIKKYGGEVLTKVISVVLDELNPALGALVGQFSGTSDEVVAYTNNLLALNDAISGDVTKQAADAYAASTRSAIDIIGLLRQHVIDLTGTFDGSAQSVAELAGASTAYRAALVQELIYIKQVEAALQSMFNSTRTTIEFAGLDKQSTYDLYQKKAADDFTKLQSTADPAEVNRLAQEINGYFNQAFSLLSPEEQLAQKQSFIDKLNLLESLTEKKLEDIGTKLTTDSADPFAAVQTALEKAAADMQKAADTQNAAANTNATAADTFSKAVDRDTQPQPPIVIMPPVAFPSDVNG